MDESETKSTLFFDQFFKQKLLLEKIRYFSKIDSDSEDTSTKG